MSVQSEIDRLNAAKTSLAAAIADQGVEVPGDAGLEDYAALVASIKTGGIPVVTTAGTGAAYTATVEGITELTAGQMLVIIPHTSSTSQAVTLNVNNLGAKNIWRYTSKSSGQISNGYNTQWIASDIPLMLVYDSAHQCWFSISLSKPYAYDLDGILNVLKGGTGQESLTSGSYLVGNGTSAVQLKTPAQVREDIGAIFTVTYGTTTYAEARTAVLAGQIPIIRSGTTIGVCVQAPNSETDETQFVFLIQHSANGGDYYVLTSSDSYAYYRKSWLPITGGTLTGALFAQNNTNYTTKQVRNVTISTAEPTASDGGNGDVWIVYEAAT